MCHIRSVSFQLETAPEKRPYTPVFLLTSLWMCHQKGTCSTIQILFLFLWYQFPIILLANRPQKPPSVFFLNNHMRSPVTEQESLSSCYPLQNWNVPYGNSSFDYVFPRVYYCSHSAHKATHHKSRTSLHSVRGHNHSNLLHWMGGGKWERKKKQSSYALRSKTRHYTSYLWKEERLKDVDMPWGKKREHPCDTMRSCLFINKKTNHIYAHLGFVSLSP